MFGTDTADLTGLFHPFPVFALPSPVVLPTDTGSHLCLNL